MSNIYNPVITDKEIRLDPGGVTSTINLKDVYVGCIGSDNTIIGNVDKVSYKLDSSFMFNHGFISSINFLDDSSTKSPNKTTVHSGNANRILILYTSNTSGSLRTLKIRLANMLNKYGSIIFTLMPNSETVKLVGTVNYAALVELSTKPTGGVYSVLDIFPEYSGSNAGEFNESISYTYATEYERHMEIDNADVLTYYITNGDEYNKISFINIWFDNGKFLISSNNDYYWQLILNTYDYTIDKSDGFWFSYKNYTLLNNILRTNNKTYFYTLYYFNNMDVNEFKLLFDDTMKNRSDVTLYDENNCAFVVRTYFYNIDDTYQEHNIKFSENVMNYYIGYEYEVDLYVYTSAVSINSFSK